MRFQWLLVAAAVQLGCGVAPAGDDPTEMASESQALTFTPILTLPPLILPPSWAYCGSSLAGAIVARRWSCTAVSGRGGSWTSTRMYFDGDSDMCRYTWSSSTGATPDYAALEAVAIARPINRSASEADFDLPPPRPDVRADCQLFNYRCLASPLGYMSTTCPVAAVHDIRIADPNDPRVLKIVNPCGACGQTYDGLGYFFLPWGYSTTTIYVPEWGATVESNGNQAFVARAPAGTSTSYGTLTVWW